MQKEFMQKEKALPKELATASLGLIKKRLSENR